jgi:hypothetical protein
LDSQIWEVGLNCSISRIQRNTQVVEADYSFARALKTSVVQLTNPFMGRYTFLLFALTKHYLAAAPYNNLTEPQAITFPRDHQAESE